MMVKVPRALMTGRTPIIYTYPYFWRNAMGGSTAFTSYPLWIASYSTAAPPTAPPIMAPMNRLGPKIPPELPEA